MNKDDRIRWIRAHLIKTDFFSKIMSDMIINSTPPKAMYDLIQKNPSLRKQLSVEQRKTIETLKTDGFQKLDISLMYKCIRYFRLVDEPSEQWGKPVLQTAITQGDDVERLNKLRNDLSHLPTASLSESEFKEFMSTCIGVASRLDKCLGRTGNRFEKEMRRYETLPIMDSDIEKKYVSLLEENHFLKEQACKKFDNCKVAIFYGQDIEDRICGETSSDFPCIVHIYGPHLNDEGIKKTAEFFKNLDESNLNIKVQRIGTGSIILHVMIYKEALKDKICLSDSLILLMEKMFPFIDYYGRCGETVEVTLYVAESYFDDYASGSLSYLLDESAAASFDCKLPRNKKALNNVLLNFAGDVVNQTNQKDTNKESEFSIVVTPKRKVAKWQKCVAIKDFNYHDDNNYLEIDEGDVIDIIEFEESDWILGQKGNKKGLVPTSSVHILEKPHDYLQKFEVLYDYYADEIEIAEGDIVVSDGIEKNGWFLAQLGHDKGFVPSIYLHRLDNQDDEISCVTALYSGEEIGNLRLQLGDVVKVVNRRKSGWVWVLHNQIEGWYPANHLKNDNDFSKKGRREDNELRIVMLGSNGSGKSATGNTILGKGDHFESKLAGSSVTRECQRGECGLGGRKIVVVDTPGLFDTQVPFEQFSTEIIRCVNMSTPGPHAFLLVIQIGRFTDEEIGAFNRIFDFFGEEMGKFAIITFTRLDDLKRENLTIEAYIKHAPTKLKEFLNRCHGRYIAINNKAAENKNTAKVKDLVRVVDSIINQNGGTFYKNEMYQEAEAALQRKIKIVEAESAREKKKGIKQMQSSFVHHKHSFIFQKKFEKSTSAPPPLPKRRPLLLLPRKTGFRDLSHHIYVNTRQLFEKSTSVPRPLPERRPLLLIPTKSGFRDLSHHTYVKTRQFCEDTQICTDEETVQLTNPYEDTQICTDEKTVPLTNPYERRKDNELRIVMLGRTGSGKSATGNTILAKTDHFESKFAGSSVTRQCQRGECSYAGRKIVVVDTPGLFDTHVPFEQISKEIIRFVNMSTPGPHAFLLVIPIARFTDEEIETFNRLFDLFGAEMGKFAIITFTKLDELESEQTTIESYIKMAPAKLEEFLNRCHGQCIAINNKASENKKIAKVNDLLKLVDYIVSKNGGKCYTNVMYKEAEAALQRKIKIVEAEKELEKKKKIKQTMSEDTQICTDEETVQLTNPYEDTQICTDEKTVPLTNPYERRKDNELRIVMLGRTGSGKSATGNTILAKTDHFESKFAGSSVTRQCQRGECSYAGRKIVVVDTPGLFDTHVPFEQISKEIIRFVNMSTPGPHAFLLVIPIARFTDEEIETFNRLFDLFGAEMGKFAIITFTKLDELESEQTTIESYIKMAPAKLEEFLNRCHGQCIAINNKASENKKIAKVNDLLKLVDYIVSKNGGKCYTNVMYKEAEAALQRKIKIVEAEKELEKKKKIKQTMSESSMSAPHPLPERRQLRLLPTKKKTPICTDEETLQLTNPYVRRKDKELRIVMLGRTGSGKSATGNTILAKTDHFESKLAGSSVTRECQRGECSHAGRKIVVVDTPGLFDTHVPFEHISKEIIRCVNMSTPGPHAFLLVIQITRFTDEEIETFNRLFDLFGAEMGNFAIITFTRLDDLESEKNTIETYIEMAPEKLKEFLNRCNGRYLAIENKASTKNKSAKVKTLINLVDSIVKQNGGQCYTNDMYKEAEAALQRKIKKVEDERAQEKKKEIEQIQSKYVNKMDCITKENNKLAQQVRSKKESQRQVQKEKDQAQQDVHRMADEMKKIDKKHNQELYQIKEKEKEKEDKEKQAKFLEEKERQQLLFVQSMEQPQIDMDKKYQNLERQKELQLAKVAEDHNKIMAAEMQRILDHVDGNNLKYDEMMKVMEEKNKAYEKLQEKMAHQHTSMNEQMRERYKEFHKLEKEHRKRMQEERDRANETLKRQPEDQKQSIEATTKALLQEQREMDKTKRKDQEKAINKAYNKLQEQLAQQNTTFEKMMREKDFQAQKQEEEHKKQIQQEKERTSIQDQEKKIQRRQSQEQLAQTNALKQKLANDNEQKLVNQQQESEKRFADEKERADIRRQQEEHKRFMDANTESIRREQKERDGRRRERDQRLTEETQRARQQWEEIQELKRQNERFQAEMKQQAGCLLS